VDRALAGQMWHRAKTMLFDGVSKGPDHEIDRLSPGGKKLLVIYFPTGYYCYHYLK